MTWILFAGICVIAAAFAYCWYQERLDRKAYESAIFSHWEGWNYPFGIPEPEVIRLGREANDKLWRFAGIERGVEE